MTEAQKENANKSITSDDALGRLLSEFLSRAVSAQTGASTKNIANQIQQAAPFKEVLEQIKNEIDQSTTQLQDEITQQALAQQAIANFGSSASQTTTTRHTTTTETPDIKKAQVSTELQQPEEMDIDGATPSTPASETPTESQEGQKKQETEPNQTEDAPLDEPSRPSVDTEDGTDADAKDKENTQTDDPDTDSRTNDAAPQNTAQTQQQNQHRDQYVRGMFNDGKKEAISNKANELGQRTGKHIYQDMKECKFKGFVLAIIIAIFIDTLDVILQIISVGTIGTIIMDFIVKPFAYGALWFILLQQGNFVTRLLRKQIAKRLIAPIILELLPFISILPVSTILVMWLQYTLYQERKKLKQELSLWEKYNNITKRAKKTLDKRSDARWDDIQHALANK